MEAYLRILVVLADSIKPMLGTCQKEVTVGASRERSIFWGHSVKCLRLIARISFCRSPPPPTA